MEVIHQEKGTVDVFHISGRLDYTASASDFENRLRSRWERDPLRRFPVLDLSGVTMLSSQTLRAVLALAKDLKGQAGWVVQPAAGKERADAAGGELLYRVVAAVCHVEDVRAAGRGAKSPEQKPGGGAGCVCNV